MSAVPSTSIASHLPVEDRKALIRIGDEEVAVRVSADGFLTRVNRRIRLFYGTELYAAVRGEPSDTDKVQPFQPGYMRIVAAMGGQLLCPPVVKDPTTGQPRANPLVETWPDGTVRRVTATALCAVRNPITGEWVVTVQTIVQDLETVLRQALLKMTENDDVVQIMSPDEWEGRERDKFKGWMAVPIAGAVLACNLKKAGVRDAWGTLLQQAATARQRACSKAERLAADHNPVTRMTWLYGGLTHPDKGPAFADITCIAWVEHTGREEMGRMLEQLATLGEAPGVGDVIDLEPVVVSDTDPDDDQVDEDRPLLEDKPDLTPAPARTPEPAEVKPATTPTATATVETGPDGTVRRVTATGAKPDPALDTLRASVTEWEEQVTPDQLKRIRDTHGVANAWTSADPAVLRTYRKALQDAVKDGAR